MPVSPNSLASFACSTSSCWTASSSPRPLTSHWTSNPAAVKTAFQESASYEYGDLVKELESRRSDFESIKIGAPLLTSDEDFKAVAGPRIRRR